MALLDSLYMARDTAGLAGAISRLEADSSTVAHLYRGVVLAWRGEATRAIETLRPLLIRPQTSFTRSQRRALLRTLSESYARTRRYDSLTNHYDRELRALDAAIEAAALAEQTRKLESAPILEALTSSEPLPPPARERIPKELEFIGLLFALFLRCPITRRKRDHSKWFQAEDPPSPQESGQLH